MNPDDQLQQTEDTINYIANTGKGLTSEEAAALFLSGGVTKDVQEAEMIASGHMFNLDAMQRAHLRRMMGFDFEIKPRYNKVYVRSLEGPHVSTWCTIKTDEKDNYGNIIKESAIDRLVDACLRLKQKWEAAHAQ
jgi:uncharacterized protein YggE